MHLDGTHNLNASPEKIWIMLQDPAVLARITPGVKSLKSLGEDRYEASSEVRLGPVSGSFKGQMEVVDKIDNQGFTLNLKQQSKIGNVSASGKISLKSINQGQTEVTFSGDAQLTGTLARTGQRLLGGVAKTMTNQFFQALENEILAAQGIVVEKVGFWTRLMVWLRKRIFSK